MTADYELDLIMEGTTSELKRMLGIVGLYSGNRQQYFSFIRVNGKEINLKNLSDDIVNKMSISGKVHVTALGPWGRYGELNEVGLFREMAEAAPEASFHAEISGNGQYEVQNLTCELKGGLLSITAFFEANDEAERAWAEDFMKKLPLREFKKLFQISGDEFDQDSYYDFVVNFGDELLCVDGFVEADFDGFVSWLEEYGGETELDEDEFSEIMANKLTPLGIRTPLDFEEEYEGGKFSEYVYDPVAKKYVGKTKPIFANGYIENANDLIAAGLRAQGLPSDDEAVANLSVEDAYVALGAILGADGDEEDEADVDDDEEETAPTASSGGGRCAGLTFAITGKVHVFTNRDAFIAYVESQGGKVSGSVSKNTNYLVNNDIQSTSSKNQKAHELGVSIISEEEFVDRFGRP